MQGDDESEVVGKARADAAKGPDAAGAAQNAPAAAAQLPMQVTQVNFALRLILRTAIHSHDKDRRQNNTLI